jgi:hypothetical protein
MAGTTKLVPPLATPDTVTTTLPVVAPAGTVTTMLVALQLATDVTAVPLKVTVLVPCVAPKFVPVMVMDAPTAHPASPIAKAATRSNIHSPPRTPHVELCTPR